MDRTKLARFLDTPIFGGLIAFLIFFSVIGFCLETLPDLHPETRRWLHYSEILTVSLFTLEYVLRIYASPSPLKFIFSFYGIIDLVAILPFYIAPTLDFRTLRLVRLLRLARLFKLIRYQAAIVRLVRAFSVAKEELIIFTFATLIFIFLSAVGIYYFERDAQPELYRSIFDALWWAVTSLTTVGYGDMYPITPGGRLFSFIVLMLGLGLVAVPTGILASALASIRSEEQKN